jgi:hypothetical protein
MPEGDNLTQEQKDQMSADAALNRLVAVQRAVIEDRTPADILNMLEAHMDPDDFEDFVQYVKGLSTPVTSPF